MEKEILEELKKISQALQKKDFPKTISLLVVKWINDEGLP